MSLHVGLERDASGLMQALAAIDRVEKAGNGEAALLNMTAAARLVTAAALARQESRGGHWRSDFPASDAQGQRTLLTLAAAEAIAAPPQRHAAP
jgi:L-aspartate oxidase